MLAASMARAGSDQTKVSMGTRGLLAKGASRTSTQPILEFELLFRLLGLVLAGPLATWLVHSLAGLNAEFGLGNTQILEFLLSPRGLLTLLVALPLVVVGVFLEQAGLSLIGGARACEGKVCALSTRSDAWWPWHPPS